MNVMLPDIHDNPHRQQAAPAYNKTVEKQINESAKQIIKNNNNIFMIAFFFIIQIFCYIHERKCN